MNTELIDKYENEMIKRPSQIREVLKEFGKELQEQQLISNLVSRSVWMVQDHNSLLIHGLFSTQQKAINFAGTSPNMAITNITVDG